MRVLPRNASHTTRPWTGVFACARSPAKARASASTRTPADAAWGRGMGARHVGGTCDSTRLQQHRRTASLPARRPHKTTQREARTHHLQASKPARQRDTNGVTTQTARNTQHSCVWARSAHTTRHISKREWPTLLARARALARASAATVPQGKARHAGCLKPAVRSPVCRSGNLAPGGINPSTAIQRPETPTRKPCCCSVHDAPTNHRRRHGRTNIRTTQ
jgi:hypothetical protein